MTINLGFKVALVLWVIFINSNVGAKKVPKVIKSLNKALGLPNKSKVVWDILSVADINTKVEENAADIAFYHPTIRPIFSSKILVTTGSGANANRSEVIDILDPSLKCQDLPTYPFNADFATGGLVKGKPIICGGGGDGSGTVNANPDCYIFDQSSWKFLVNLATRRSEASSVVLWDELWVTGGYTNLYGDAKTTEFVSTSGIRSWGPELPGARDDHCMVTLHNGTILLLGHDGDKQYGGQPPNNTFFYDPMTETFRTGQDMNYHRVNAGCALFESAYHGGRPIVIVVGGTSKGGDYKPLKKTEILDYTVTDEWSEFIDIPMERSSAFGGRMLPNPIGDGAYFIHRRDIWEIVCNPYCHWVEKTQKLEIEREGLVAMYIPEEMAICN